MDDDCTLTFVVAMGEAIVRQGLAALLTEIQGFQLAGEASDGLEAVQLVERLHPDILIVGLMIPSLNGLEVTRRVRELSPATRVIVVSMYADEAYVLEALSSGASGYVLKEADAADLVTAVREVAAGRRHLSPPLSEDALRSYAERVRDAPPEPYDTLTAREREVLKLAAEGGINRSIAAQLSISPRTVEAHRASVMQKLGLRTQSDLVRYALRRGIIPTE